MIATPVTLRSTRALASGILLISLLCLIPALAQDPKIRVSLGESGEVWVGQRITLVVELLAPGYFDSAPAFDLPDPPGLLLIPPAGSPVVSNEDADGITYTVQRHDLSVIPKRGGAQNVPPLTVRFRYKKQPLDKDAIPITVRSQPLGFTAKVPPGAENPGGVISARNLTAVESWKPEHREAKAGDAFTRTITFSAPDVPAMAFPPFPTVPIDGLGIYPKAPVVLDHSDRGDLHGERRDTITYVCKRPGTIVIPAARFTWFDLDSKRLKSIDFPARTLEIAPNPALASAAANQDGSPAVGTQWKQWALLAAGVAIASALAIWLLRSPWPRVAIARWIRPFLPTHLQPLNPGGPKPPV